MVSIIKKLRDSFRVSKKTSEPSSKTLTRYARVYGDSKSYLFQNDPYRNKSGITPRKLAFDQPTILTPVTHTQDMLFDQYQTEKLAFTTQQAFDSGAFWDHDALPNDLQNDIFQGFRRDRWKRPEDSEFLMNDGTGRMLSMHHDDVYDAYLPVLRLASRIMEYAQHSEWWDALIAGERRPIDASRVPEQIIQGLPLINNTSLRSFHRRTREERLKNPINWDGLVPNLQLEFAAIDNLNPSANLFARTVTTSHGKELKQPEIIYDVTLRINPKLVYPLMFLPISTNERLVQQFLCAVTMVHEYAHCISHTIDRRAVEILDKHFLVGFEASDTDTLKNVGFEPFFEDEEYSEIGYSAEKALFGGTISDSPAYPRERPPNLAFTRGGPRMFLSVQNWPPEGAFLVRDSSYEEGPHLAEVIRPLSVSTKWPLPMRFVQDIQQEDFWNNVIDLSANTGLDLDLFPKICASVRRSKNSEWPPEETFERINWPRWDEWVEAGKPDPDQFAQDVGVDGYGLVQVPEALRTIERLELRRAENERRDDAVNRALTLRKQQEIERFQRNFEEEKYKYDLKREGEWNEVLEMVQREGGDFRPSIRAAEAERRKLDKADEGDEEDEAILDGNPDNNANKKRVLKKNKQPTNPPLRRKRPPPPPRRTLINLTSEADSTQSGIEGINGALTFLRNNLRIINLTIRTSNVKAVRDHAVRSRTILRRRIARAEEWLVEMEEQL